MMERSSCAGVQAPVRVLAATASDEHYNGLERAIVGTSWSLFRSDTIVEGLNAVINHQINVIFAEGDLGDGTWGDLIRCLEDCHNAPQVIVFSPCADDRLWAEVLGCGGYDLLAIPFDPKEVLRVGHRAWLSWQNKVEGFESPWFPVRAPASGGSGRSTQSHIAGGIHR